MPSTPDPLGVNPTWSSRGGTAFATAIMAGVQALVNQKAGTRQGNPNYRLYQLAAKEYGVSGSSSCNSSNGNMVGGSCVFYDVDARRQRRAVRRNAQLLHSLGYHRRALDLEQLFCAGLCRDHRLGLCNRHRHINVSNLVTNWALKAATATHDYDGDAKSDIAWRDTTGNTAVWMMNGAQVASSGGFRRGAHHLVDRRAARLQRRRQIRLALA